MTPAQLGQYETLAYIVLMGMFVYFIWWRPQQRQRKEQAAMLSALRPGDRVMTSGGMLGIITEVLEDEIALEIAEDVTVRVIKAAVARKLED